MNAKARKARKTVREMSLQTRLARRAQKAMRTGEVQSAKTYMLSAGICYRTANRFAGAFSTGQTPVDISETEIKLRGRRTKMVPIKLYDRETFETRLNVYRPKTDLTAQVEFERAAQRIVS